uniref:NADH-ubiquinone oxidoreductase chain 5 n=1 Tax=Cryptocellus narino TaxID=1329480 RepID=W5R4F6_9ARAC|nr:NADH dehydrogenase subunit 5 [Cryptocellus narino]AGL11926.1 NADH dehydrogenase subunit 5 [Cryptocellus narino]
MNVFIITGVVLMGGFFVCFFLCLYVLSSDVCILLEYSLGEFVGSGLDFIIVIDWMSVMFMSLVLLISSCVFLYSVEYMDGDLYSSRFCLLVLLFVFSMGLLIFSCNLVSILLGWDGLGLVSYALVIYYQNVRSLNAGMITVLSNRIGDVGLLMAIVWMFGFGNWNFLIYVDLLSDANIGLVGLFVLLGGLTSSAQIPFSAWLPAAMAAPTPVSALVHSSTLVTAGVYLLIRFGLYYTYDFFSWVLVGISVVTMFMAGFCALWEMDMSSVVALSTLSQLGFMMFILGFGLWGVAFFHLLTHALFKSLLFLCVGYMIHGYGGEQDFRGVGGLVGSPIISSGMNISLLALMGFPFLAGFYSKDLIIEFIYMGSFGYLMVIIFGFGLGLTVMYGFRLGYLGLWSDCLYSVGVNVGEGFMMEFSVLILSMFSVFFGSFLMWWLFWFPCLVYVNLFVSLFGVMLLLIGFFICWFLFFFNWWSMYSVSVFDYYGGSMWFVVDLSGNYLCSFLDEKYSNHEVGWSEVIGGWGLRSFFWVLMQWLELLWDNVLGMYLFFMVIWVLVVAIIF